MYYYCSKQLTTILDDGVFMGWDSARYEAIPRKLCLCFYITRKKINRCLYSIHGLVNFSNSLRQLSVRRGPSEEHCLPKRQYYHYFDFFYHHHIDSIRTVAQIHRMSQWLWPPGSLYTFAACMRYCGGRAWTLRRLISRIL